MSDVVKQVLDRLDALAAKLGVAVQFIFTLYTRNALIVGYELLTFCVLSAVASILLAFRVAKMVRSTEENRRRYDENWPEFAIVLSVFVVILLLVSVFCGANFPQYIFNPQYQAFQDLVNTIK